MKTKLNKHHLAALILVILGILLLTANAVMQSLLFLHDTGTVKTVGVGADVSTIDWGLVAPGSYTDRTVNFKASGTAPVTLSFYTQNWIPATPVNASDYITLSWNYTGALVTSSWTPVRLTLYVMPTIYNVTTFSFDIVVVGTG